MKFTELVDIDKLRELCESYTAINGAVTAILALDGEVLIATGWKDICTRFHRVHETTLCRCVESDTVLAASMEKGESYHMYRCRNGLVDVAVPIVIRGEHLANFFTGQFFIEPPDRDYFIRQAEELGFDKEPYLDALDKVPVFSEDSVRSMMRFFTLLVEMIAEMGLARKELEEVNLELRTVIAERKQVEASLRESEQRFRALVNTIPDLIWLKDAAGVYLSCNEMFEHLFGAKKEAIIGKTDYDFVAKELADRFRENDLKVMSTGQLITYEQLLTFADDGHPAWIETTKTPMHDSAGGLVGVLGVGHDITQRKHAEKELAQKQKQLEELNKYLEQRVAEAVLDSRKKDEILILQGRQAAMGEMIGNIAHQWRQPLNNLGLIVQELRMIYSRGEFSKEYLEGSVKKAMEWIAYMSKTIDDFSDYFKPSNRKMLFSVNQIVAKTVSLVEPSLKKIDIHVDVIENAKVDIYGYANEYSQVLLNILLNSRDAFQRCDSARDRVVTITIGNEGKVSVVTVADNAGGIPEAIVDKIFDPYFTTKGPDKGTGIGLYMAKAIIEKNMHGRLTVRNVANGAEFRIEV
jgi:PAS domain S-box-containing protein